MALVLEEYKRQNSNVEFGVFGFCFGGKITAHALDEYAEDIKVGAQFHPAGITEKSNCSLNFNF
jgi:dienelactone hydrolase